ncbi:hypothetical protein [Thermomonas sp.]|uniref:hypothetical protein n=1 Tax=Thermomonas sp. TaxID=1971895 RepID=UPI0035AE5CEB
MKTAQRQATGIQIPAPIIKEGRGSWSSVAPPGSDAALTALKTLGGVARQEQAKQTAMIPTFQAQAAGLREQAGADRARAATLGANKLLAGVGAAPLPTPAPAVARPDFSSVKTGFSTRQAPVARTASQLEQASRDEVVARHEANGTGATGGAIAAPAASGYFIGGDGTRKAVNGDGSIAGSNHTVAISRPGAAVSVDQGAGVGVGPRVPSTYGLSVNDPRLDDQQAAIARPTGSFRGASEMSEHYRAKESAEAIAKMSSSIDSQIFAFSLAAQRGEPAAIKAISDLNEQKAGLLSGQAQLSEGAVQGRENRDNRLQVTGAEQAGQDRRTDAQIRLGDRNTASAFEIAQMEDGTKRTAIAAEIARPQYTTDREGRYVSVSGNIARPVVDENGSPMLAQAERATGEITPALQYERANNELKALLNNPPMEADKPAYNQQLATVRQQIASLEKQGREAGATKVRTIDEYNKLPKGTRYLAPDGGVYTKP